MMREWYGKHFLGAEMAGAFAVSAAFVYWAEFAGGNAIVDGVLTGNRGAVYGALTSLFGTLLGFSIATVSIVLGFINSERLEIVRNSTHYPTLWRIFNSANWVLGFATVFALAALVIDTDRLRIRWMLYANLVFLLLSMVRVARCVWVLEKVINLITAPSKKRDAFGNTDSISNKNSADK